MVSASAAAVFTIVARDAASSVMGTIGKSMGKLQSTAGTLFKGLVAGAAAAGAAFLGMAAASIKAAMDDQKAQARMVATLQARGMATEKNLAAIDATILASQKYGQTDDDVRKSIETATQYTKSFTAATKISAVATQLAAAKGMSLEEATAIVGKAYQGNGKALKSLGIDLKRTGSITEKIVKIDKKGIEHVKEKTKQYTYYIKGQKALNLVLDQYGGIADAVAATPAAKLEAAQIRVNEAFESFGAAFLPGVSDVLDSFATNVLPKVEQALKDLGPVITDAISWFVDDFIPKAIDGTSKQISPLLEKLGLVAEGIGELGTKANVTFGDDWGKAFQQVSISETVLKGFGAVLDDIISKMRLLGLLAPEGLGGGTLKPQLPGAPGRGGTPRRGGPSYGEPVTLQSNNLTVNLGTKFVNDLDATFGAKFTTRGGSRTIR